MKINRPVPSEFDKNVVYPAGTPVTVVERLPHGTVFVEIRIPDDSLVGGARYDTVLIKNDWLDEQK